MNNFEEQFKALLEYLKSEDCRYIRAFLKGQINNMECFTKEEVEFILLLKHLKSVLGDTHD